MLSTAVIAGNCSRLSTGMASVAAVAGTAGGVTVTADDDDDAFEDDATVVAALFADVAFFVVMGIGVMESIGGVPFCVRLDCAAALLFASAELLVLSLSFLAPRILSFANENSSAR